jgi:hypothetical protein
MVVALCERRIRRYAVYISETQDQADKHVATIAAMLESCGVDRAVNKYGMSKGWRRNRLRTANYTIDALGLDTATRGIKVEADRPDLMVLDDIDDLQDSPAATTKKIDTLTATVLPVGSPDCAVLAIQNLVLPNGVFARLADGRADFLADRIVSGPYKALEDFAIKSENGELVIEGTPTWAGQGLVECLGFVKTWGSRAFVRECQQDVVIAQGGLWIQTDIDALRVTTIPQLTRIAVAIDPSATGNATSDEAGIVVGGIGPCRCKGFTEIHGFLLEDLSQIASPEVWASIAVGAYNKYRGDRMVAESNNGGEMVKVTIGTVKGAPPVKLIHASRGKITRAEPVAALSEQKKIHHMGHFDKLEGELCGYTAGSAKSPGRLDSFVFLWTELLLPAGAAPSDEDMALWAKGEGFAKPGEPLEAPPLEADPEGGRVPARADLEEGLSGLDAEIADFARGAAFQAAPQLPPGYDPRLAAAQRRGW